MISNKLKIKLIMNKIEDYNFDKNDWAHFHDVILDVTWFNGKINLNQEEMEKLFWELPEDMRMDAQKCGMNDTPWRDSLWAWYERNKIVDSKLCTQCGLLTNKLNKMETEGIKIKFDDGTEYRLPDISYEKFTEHMFKSGSSDLEYDKYCRENNMKELTDFNGESTGEITLIVEQPYRGRVLKFRCIYDSDNDENFNEASYFGTDI